MLVRSRWAAIGAAVAVTLGGGGISLVGAAVDSGDQPITVFLDEPCRLLHTGKGIGRSTPLQAGEIHTVAATEPTGPCNVPAGAVGLVTNVTALNATANTNLRFFPAGGQVPGTSNLNPRPGGAPTPNAVTVGLNGAGQFSIRNAFGTVDVIVDVAAYLVDHDHDDRYYTQTEVDTKLAGIPEGPEGPAGPMGPEGPEGPPGPPNRLTSEQIALLQWHLDPGAAAVVPTGDGPQGIAFDGSHIWVANNLSSTVSKIDPATGTRVDYPTLADPEWLAFDGTSIWVTHFFSDNLSKIDPSNGARVDYSAGDGPAALAFGAGSMWVANYGADTVSKVNPSDGTRVDYPTGDGPTDVAFDGTSIWIANFNTDTASKMDPTNGTRVDYPTGDGPSGVAFDGTSIWVTNQNAGTVSRIDPVNGTKVDDATGQYPLGVAFDGTNVWITNYGSDTVSKLDQLDDHRHDDRYVPHGEITMGYGHVFTPNGGSPPSVTLYSNAFRVTSSGGIEMGLPGPAAFGAVDYGLVSVSYCLTKVTAPGFVTTARVYSFGPGADDLTDSFDETDRTTVGCYTIPVTASTATSHTLSLAVTGNGEVDVTNVTAIWAPN